MRICSRTGCREPAVARIGFDALQSEVVLDGELVEPRGFGWLCEHHVATLRPPRGWYVVDRREAVPRLFVPAPSAPRRSADTVRRGEPPGAPRGATERGAGDLGVADAEVIPLPVPLPFETAVSGPEGGAALATHAAAHTIDDLEPSRRVRERDLLSPGSPLLSRAFAKGWGADGEGVAAVIPGRAAAS